MTGNNETACSSTASNTNGLPTSPTRRYGLILLTVGAMTLLGSCGFLKKDKPKIELPKTPLSQIPFETQVIVTSTSDINPNAGSRPSPVRIRFFLTDGSVDLKTMPFETIFEFGESDLTEKPVATVVLKPDTMLVVPIKGMRSQSTLTIAAAFRDPFSVQWIESRTIDTIGDGNITATINTTGVEFD